MKLVIGGYAQGKFRAACACFDACKVKVWDGILWETPVMEEEQLVINHFHLWVKKCVQEKHSMEQEIEKLLQEYPNCVIISDEIGNGIVPMDPFEREYREKTGRILKELATRAEEVERVFCGLRQKIK